MNFLKRISLFLLTNIAVLVVFSIILGIIGYFFPGFMSSKSLVSYVVYALIFGFTGSIISLFLSRWIAKKTYNIQLVDGNTLFHNPKMALVWRTVERIARENNIQTPEVGYYESLELNAFATGATRDSALVVVTTGLLNGMESDEIEAVVGHEMAHVLNGDMVTLTLIQGVVNAFVIFLSRIVADLIDAYLSSDDGKGMGVIAYGLVYTVLQIVFGFAASLIVMYFSRYREYRADEGGARYTSKRKMISALKKLQQTYDGESQNKTMSPFMIAEPDSVFSTHPSLSNRIKALEENISLV